MEFGFSWRNLISGGNIDFQRSYKLSAFYNELMLVLRDSAVSESHRRKVFG